SIPKPGNPISCQSMIMHISPIGTLAKSKTIETSSSWLSDYSHSQSRIIPILDRKSTRLNSSHGSISYAVFCLKKKKKYIQNEKAVANYCSEVAGEGSLDDG